MLDLPTRQSVSNSGFVAMRQLKMDLTNAGVFGSESGGPFLQHAAAKMDHVRVHKNPQSSSVLSAFRLRLTKIEFSHICWDYQREGDRG